MDFRQFFFKYRSYTPVPLLILAIALAKTSIYSFLVGFILALNGEIIRIWAVRYAGSATRTTGEVGADELVTDGPYGYVRNPLYVGNFFLSSGILIMTWAWMPWLLILFLILFAVQYGAIISLEEDFLREKFQDTYPEYAHNVPRFVPRFKSWGRGVRRPTTIKKALHTERRTLQSFSGVVLIVILRWLLG